MENKKCKYWRTSSKIIGWDNDKPILDKAFQYCVGTKEQEACSCDGKESQCNFYPKIRNKNIKNTFEMWVEAQKNKKYYKTIKGNLIYQADKGLFYKNNMSKCPLEIWDNNENNLDSLMMEKWEECEEILTKTEAENKYNIKIIEG